MNGVMIFRLSDTEISIDGCIFIKGKYGAYYAEREELRELNVFRSYISAFLEMEESIRITEFEDELEGMLFESGINFSDL